MTIIEQVLRLGQNAGRTSLSLHRNQRNLMMM
jgi:hypothetical protein